MKPDPVLVVIDMQAKLMPHIDNGAAVLKRCVALVKAADLLDIPVLVTEQNPRGLGPSVDGLIGERHRVIEKESFDATLCPDFVAALPSKETVLFVAGCEAHVCVLLTVTGLRRLGYTVELIADAVGSRAPENKAIALARAQHEGALPTTTESTIFGWLGSCRHPRFRDALALVK
ncbi:isochorismatase family protein [Caballeronia sp. SEWSISQ10-4 2]|uniref:isochorismatase family protein n=1 Tax=Caballeronia sp. SEWSISQ10-4 2 TaxID=2937438 RepID=UPI002652905C|nr:isochorismatase family protein [Caballeronia sp. SEWSISQ10-4 2]MDN7177786.1 isochorismatase family protein [Caballeronia sp. SEWSISQ10-4 2]